MIFVHADFYEGLLRLKKPYPALRHGAAGGTVQWLETGHLRVLRFRRSKSGRRLQVTVNLT